MTADGSIQGSGELTKKYVSLKMQIIFQKKFAHWPITTLASALEEFVKFAAIASEVPDIFLPCSMEIDEVWHEYILETGEYQRFCDRLKPGNFIHHSGLEFDDFKKQRLAREVVEQDISILLTYVASFGAFTAESVRFWVVADYYFKKFNQDIDRLNAFIKSLQK